MKEQRERLSSVTPTRLLASQRFKQISDAVQEVTGWPREQVNTALEKLGVQRRLGLTGRREDSPIEK